MRAKFIALLILSCAVPATRVTAQDEGASEDVGTLPATGGDGHGWVAPNSQDQQLLRTHGSRLSRIFLNLRGLGRLVFSYRDKMPGASAPPNGKLVRAPGLGIQASRYVEPRADVSRDDEVVNFPRAVDNSELPCFPPIFYQGELNSRTSVAVTYYQLTHMTGLARGWDQKRPGATRFSPLWTFNLINGGNNLGAFQSKAYTALLAHGAATLKEVPYRSSLNPATNYRRWPDDPELWQRALEYRIERFGVIQDNNVVSLLRRIKLLLVNGHVLTTATAIDGWNKETIVDNPYSRLDNPYVGEFIATTVAKVPGNHCITIVGYNDDIWVDLNGNGQVDPGEKGALKIANSWGTADWNRGFRWLHYSALYAPRDEDDAAVRAPALYANQVFWMTAARDYNPELVMQVDLPPMYRNEYSLSAGVGNRPEATDATAPNFAYDFNGGRYGIDGRGNPQSIRAVLDVTKPAQRLLSQDPEFFIKLVKPARAGPMLPRAYLTETNTGVIHELALSSTGQPGVYSARAPVLSTPDDRELRLAVPTQLDVPESGSITVPIEIDGSPINSGNVDVKVFSCNASVLATNDLAIERDASGRTQLRINRPVRNGGSCLLSLHASDGKRSANSSIRINLVGAHEASPVLTNGAVHRDGLSVTIPFNIKATAAASNDDVLFFFDTSNVDVISSYDVTGTGSDRVLTLKLRYWQPFYIDASVYDGHYVGTSRVKIGS